MLAHPGASRTRGRDDHRGGAVEAAHVLGEPSTGLHRLARRLAPEQERAGLRLDDEVRGGTIGERATGAER